MKKLKISKEQQQRVIDRVKRIESQVDIEVIPFVVRRSAAIGHVQTIIFLCLLFLILSLDLTSRVWLSPLQEVALTIFGLIALFPLSSWLADFDVLQRWLTKNSDEEKQVQEKAELCFFQNKLDQTERRNSVLLYLSLMEKRSFIVSDKAIREVLSPEIRAKAKKAFSGHYKDSDVDRAFIAAIDVLEEALKSQWPAPTGKKNEQDDQIRIKD